MVQKLLSVKMGNRIASSISRRTFLAWISSTIGSQAATPLINLERSNLPLWKSEQAISKPFLQTQNKQPIFSADGKYFDFEEDVTEDQYSSSFSKHDKVKFHKTFTAELFNVHTKETQNFFIDEMFNAREVPWRDFDYFCRDWRRGEYIKMDPNILIKLLKVMEGVVTNGDVLKANVLSAYRSKKTNDMLRLKSSKVAKNSFHIIGKAIDVQIPGTSIKELHKYSNAVSGGGVGVYETFVHLDTGPNRRWGA